jgi:hypothetical protein
MGGLPTSFRKRSASTDLDVPAVLASSSSVQV